MIRKFTIYFRNNGTDLLKDLFEKGQYSFEDFYKWFRISGVRKEQKTLDVKRMIQRLIDEDVILREEEDNLYYLTQNAPIKVVELVNRGIIRFDMAYHYEKELFSIKNLYYFVDPWDQGPFYRDLQYLIGENLFQIKYWKSIDNQYGQLISYVRAEEYYEKVIQSKVEIKPVYSHSGTINDIHSDIKDNVYVTSFNGYFALKNHFRKCFDKKCRICGKNAFNLISAYMEKIKAELRARNEYPVLMNYLKKFPYKTNVEHEEVKIIQAKIDDLIQFDKEKFSKSKKDTVLSSLSAHLKSNIIGIVVSNRLRLEKEQEYRVDRKDKQSYYSEIERLITEYKRSIRKVYQQLNQNPLLESIDLKIGKKIDLDKKTFQKYNKNIRKIGREGEKRIYEGLIEIYRDHPHITPVWNNEEKEAGLPYDILLSNTKGEDEYIEVKTTHTDKRSFIMSEEEIKFAMNNSDKYKLYFIVNIGTGADSYKIVIDNFRKDYGKRLRTISTRLTYE